MQSFWLPWSSAEEICFTLSLRKLSTTVYLEEYLEPFQTTMTKFSCENSQWLLIIYYFRKKAQSQILTVFYIHIRYGYLLTRISVLRGVNRRNIFLEKSYIKCGEETIPRHFSKKSKLSESLDQQSSVLQLVFVVGQVEGYQYILKLN